MHEHLDEVGIIHMNGRIYDPLIGRFMSADPYIQAPTNLKTFNRYSYVWNNPSEDQSQSNGVLWSLGGVELVDSSAVTAGDGPMSASASSRPPTVADHTDAQGLGGPIVGEGR